MSGAAGAALLATLGPNAVLCECTVIAAEPGATAQEVHSDGDWSATSPRVVTMFIALHDVLDEASGPTYYCPETHAPRCFSSGRWLPPSDAQAEARTTTWFALHAGDAVLMAQTCWHYGGANTSERRRTLLCVSFFEPDGAARTGGGAGRAKSRGASAAPRLADFVTSEREASSG